MKICIGIISYFPDNFKIALNRINKLNTLIKDCDQIFDLPITIIAQNWTKYNTQIKLSKNCNVIEYSQGLGIPQARKALREWFLESEYDYLIMLDDDCILQGNKAGGLNYINQLKSHPCGVGTFRDRLLKLFAISKEIYREVDIRQVDLIKGEASEDNLLWLECKLKFPSKWFNFMKDSNLDESSSFTEDENSTWFNNFLANPEHQDILANTDTVFNQIEYDYLQNIFNKEICIGVISYLPENITIRAERIKRLNTLYQQLATIFPNFTILTVAQNWKESDNIRVPANAITYKYTQGLGVVGARKALQNHFLRDSAYDHIILIEDDCNLKCQNQKDIYQYLKTIHYNPRGFGKFHSHLLKLVAISRFMYKQIEHYEVDYQNNEGYDDWIFVETIFNKYPNSVYQLPRNIIEDYSNSLDDTMRVWDISNFNQDTCALNSALLVKKLSAQTSKIIGLTTKFSNCSFIKYFQKKRLLKTIKHLTKQLNLPIILVAENINQQDEKEFNNYNNLFIYRVNSDLGMTLTAYLQQVFMNDFEVEWLLLTESNCRVKTNTKNLKYFYKELDIHKDGWSYIENSPLKFLAVSKGVCKEVIFPSIFKQDSLNTLLYIGILISLKEDSLFTFSKKILKNIAFSYNHLEAWFYLNIYKKQFYETANNYISNYIINELVLTNRDRNCYYESYCKKYY